MTSDEFRNLALTLPEASESAHMNHPDFRIAGKIFATLSYPKPGYAMVKLTPEQQQDYIRLSPAAFQPASGAWGRSGSTQVQLADADETLVTEALTIAFRLAQQKAASKRPNGRARP